MRTRPDSLPRERETAGLAARERGFHRPAYRANPIGPSPMRDGLSTTEATAPTPQATAADAEPLARAVRDVLIADPDPVTQTVLQIVLRQRGYRTRSVLTAAEAIEALERHPGAVVTELVFPDRRGPDVVHAARSLSRETVVLVLSEISADGAVVEALKAGAHDYVRKPFSPEELIARLERHATPD